MDLTIKQIFAGIHLKNLAEKIWKIIIFRFFQKERGINLIKLHGALHIFVQGDEKNYLKNR